MPIFEYVCRDCDHHFEAFVQGAAAPACPSCQSPQLDKQLSVFAVSTRGAAPDMPAPAPCGACGDPRGPGACAMN
jgi:putative FmdB family regulatory protein